MKLIGQAFRFATVGILSTLAHVAVGLALAEGAGLPAFWANFAAFGGAVLVSYFGNLAWTFGLGDERLARLPRFLVIAAAGLLFNQMIVFPAWLSFDQPRRWLPSGVRPDSLADLSACLLLARRGQWRWPRSFDSPRAAGADLGRQAQIESLGPLATTVWLSGSMFSRGRQASLCRPLVAAAAK
jgi:putative flippase GtrA